ncbi:hypothetical protein NHF46_12790 [Arthrobacter alpinus]|nr:hypothetical protein [Arthrobacter alpinus]
MIAELGKPVIRVGFKRTLETLMGTGTPAFPPLDDAQGREYRSCMDSSRTAL